MTNKKAYIAIVLVILLVIGVGVYFRKNNTKTEAEPKDEVSSQVSQKQQKDETPAGPFWEGLLKASDNGKKGNLMLVTGKSTIYISTNRDYSDLLGKQVRVSYEGNLDSFRLGDITEN